MAKVPLTGIWIQASIPDTVDIIGLHQAIERLDRQRRLIVVLRFYFGLTHEQIGQELGLAEDTVKKKWAAIKARLYLDLKGRLTKFPLFIHSLRVIKCDQ